MSNIKLNLRVKSEIEKITEISKFIWERGWAERNGGNISVNLTKIFGEFEVNYKNYRYVKVSQYPKELAKKIFFVTGTGERMRDLKNPEESSCIIEFDKEANGYYIIWGGIGKENFRPTSELISHMKLQLALEKSPKKYTTILHTHPTEMLCFSHHPVLGHDEAAFNKAIWSMLPEVRLFLPQGVALLPYTLPGSEKIADLTVEGLKAHDVALWSKHGALSAGKDIIEAFDFLDVANKGCMVYLKCLASGFTPEGMTDEDMEELCNTYLVPIQNVDRRL